MISQILPAPPTQRRVKRFALAALWLAPVLGVTCAANLARGGDEKLPSGDAVLDRYVEVTGGKAAYEKIYNRKLTGTYEFVAQKMVGSVLLFQARPVKLYSRFEQEAFGIIESGTDGDVVWMRNKRGVVEREGEPRDAMLHESYFDGATDWRKLYKKAECTGIKEVDGKPCYVVVLTPAKLPQPRTHYYDKETGLLTMTEVVNPDPNGNFTVTKRLSEYKKADGILFPCKETISLAGEQRMRHFDTVEHNVDIPDDKFTRPLSLKERLGVEGKPTPDASSGEAEKGPGSGDAKPKAGKPEAKGEKAKDGKGKPD